MSIQEYALQGLIGSQQGKGSVALRCVSLSCVLPAGVCVCVCVCLHVGTICTRECVCDAYNQPINSLEASAATTFPR